MLLADWLYMRVRAVSEKAENNVRSLSKREIEKTPRTCRLHDGADAETGEGRRKQVFPDAVFHAQFFQLNFCEVVGWQLDGAAHRRAKHGRVDTPGESLDPVRFNDDAECVQDGLVLMLRSDGIERRVCLHPVRGRRTF